MFLARLNSDIIGKTLGKSLYTGNGGILLSAGSIISDVYVNKLIHHGYQSLYILDGEFDDVEIDDAISGATRSRALALLADLYEATQGGIELSRRLSHSQLAPLMDTIISDVMASPNFISPCSDLKSYDEYTYHHSVNVCVISLQLGRKVGISREMMRTLGCGALLHDIGMLRLPHELLVKPGELTRDEIALVRRHCTLGWESLKPYTALGPVSRSATLQHHEFYDGTGYPKGLFGENISWVSRYTCIADVFDALTSDRPFRKATPNKTVLDNFMPISDSRFDPKLLATLHRLVCPYPPGAFVNLSSGCTAIVLRVNANTPDRPTVRVLSDDNNRNELNLSNEPTVYITGLAPEGGLVPLRTGRQNRL